MTMETRRLLGLFFIVFFYILIGAAIFQSLEAEKETEIRRHMDGYMDEFLGEHLLVNKSALSRIMWQTARHCDVTKRMLEDTSVWTYTGSVGFAVTVLTTIGYGHLSPESDLGKVVCVFYALFGIPLTLLLLNEVATKMHKVSLRIGTIDFCQDRPKANRVFSCLLVMVLGIIVMFIVPAAIFSALENWSFIEGLYYCFITLSTIGFGDYIACIHTPDSHGAWWMELYKVGLFSWVLFGLAYLTLVIKYLMHFFAEGFHQHGDVNREALEKEIEQLQEKIKEKQELLSKYSDECDCETKHCEKQSFPSCFHHLLHPFSRSKVNTGSPSREMSSFDQSKIEPVELK